MIAPEELTGWLRLALTPGVGVAAARRLLTEFGLPQHAIGAPRRLLARHLGAEVAAQLHAEEVTRAVARAIEWSAISNNSIVTLADADYPRVLLEIGDPPLLLYCRGRRALLNQPSLAIVGSRNATPQGLRNAEQFAHAFSSAGLTIVSGLALGIDAAAHQGGLLGAGSTIAVLGTGIDLVYPPQHAALAARIGEAGLLVSEFPLQTPSLRQNFPRRNRIISGLSRGCLVVEAALGSGSLITARAAVEQGREVFAIPGSIHSPLARGCHALIKSGAKLVETADDVLGELQPQAQAAPTVAPATSAQRGAHDSPLLAHLGYDPLDIDALCARSGLPADEVGAELLRLELEGIVVALPGARYQRLA